MSVSDLSLSFRVFFLVLVLLFFFSEQHQRREEVELCGGSRLFDGLLVLTCA